MDAYIDAKVINAFGRSADNPFKTQAGADNLIKRDQEWAASAGIILVRVQVGPKAWLVDAVETDDARRERLARACNQEYDVVFYDGEGTLGRILYETNEVHPAAREREARRWVQEGLPGTTFVRIEERS